MVVRQLTIVTFNAGKGLGNTDACLQSASEVGAAAVVVTEPWRLRTEEVLEEPVVRRHPSYDESYGLDRTVALYLRKDLGWQVRTVARHTVAATLGRVALVAAYWHPDDASADSETLDVAGALRRYDLVLTGDFNERHRLWEASRRRARPRARRLADWASARGSTPLVRDKPTHRRGGVIDNFFAPAWMGVADVRHDLGFRSDHLPVVATLFGEAVKSSVPARVVVPLRRYDD